VSAGKTPSFNDATYLAKTRDAKLSQIMEQVLVSDAPQKWYNSLQLAGLFTESMEPTMHQVGDEMPKATFGYRQKLIHTQGAIAEVKLVQKSDHPFTGIFSEADTGIIRMSAAAKPDVKSQPLAPGIALKFLRDGMDSASLVSMYSVDGQSSWNFFANDFTNHIPAVSSVSLLPLAAKFHTATEYVQAVGLSDFAQYT
jgi:hypothetical protein